MGLLRNVAIVVLLISLTTFIALFGRLPALRNTPVGYLHRAICVRLPAFLESVDQNVTNGKITASTSRAGHYIMHENHPIILIVYLLLLTGASLLFLSSAWTQLPTFQHYIISIVLPMPYALTYITTHSKKSQITVKTHAHSLAQYPYDNVIYRPRVMCRTCQWEKPARSKHCPLCGTCVAKHDHHCMWVMTCLGKENYRWFLSLLFSLGLLLNYGTFLAYTLLSDKVRPRQTRRDQSVLGILDAWSGALGKDVRVGAVGLLALLTAPLAWGLLAYHIYLIWAGMTTNETSKWNQIREDMADGIMWRGKQVKLSGQESEASLMASERWPVSSSQVLVRTRDGKAPIFQRGSTEKDLYDETWEQCWHLGQVQNLYDLGWWDNLMDVMFTAIPSNTNAS